MIDGAKVQQLIGLSLDDVYGHGTGRVAGAYRDVRTGDVVWLVVRVGLIAQRHYAVPPEGLVIGGGHAWLPQHRDAIRSSPEVGPGEPLTRGQERRLLEHYGRTGTARYAELRERGPLISATALAGAGRPATRRTPTPTYGAPRARRSGPRIPAVERRRAGSAGV